MEVTTERIKWKPGYRSSVDAETAWTVYNAVREKQGGTPSASELLQEAKSKDCPIHDAFEWNDSIAGHQFRLTQARSMMRSFVVVPEPTSSPKEGHRVLEIQVVQNVDGERKAAYVHVEDIMKDPVARAELLHRALSELLAIRRRYKHLQELSTVFAEIEAVMQAASAE